MKLSFGEYSGHDLQNVIVQHPEYIASIMALKHPSGPVASVVRETLQMLREFDEEPLACPCSHANCGKNATRLIVSEESVTPASAWCDQHAPDAGKAVLHAIRTYREAIVHVQTFMDGAKGQMQRLVKALARAKSLDKTV